MAGVRKQLEIDEQILRGHPGDPSAQRSQVIAWAQTVYVDQQKQGKFIPQYQRVLESVRKRIAICRKALAV